MIFVLRFYYYYFVCQMTKPTALSSIFRIQTKTTKATTNNKRLTINQSQDIFIIVEWKTI